MYNFHVGQKVVCVDARPPRHGGNWRLIKGDVYTIRGFDDEDEDDIGLYLEEIPDDPVPIEWKMPRGWAIARFRPVKTTNISILTAMLVPTPTPRVLASAE